MENSFILGCNYWASDAGTEMWRCFHPGVIREDLRILGENGVRCLRVFPLWRDFQPIAPIYGGEGKISHYRREDGTRITDPWGLDREAMDRFGVFLELCRGAGLQVIVGLITGWMSGRLFVPSALYGKNVITDPQAVYYEHLFIRGFIERFRQDPAVMAWDLGNECNCMGAASRYEAAAWTAGISAAIRAADPTRPVLSGMHSLEADPSAPWQIRDQGRFTDILTTHPYPYWCEHTRIDGIRSVRTTCHATAQTRLYSDLGARPCLAEEIGTMGPMLCSDKAAGDFFRLNLFSLWANGAAGAMWWCANDQDRLMTAPYTENMCEQELGMITSHRTVKPVLRELRAFDGFLKTLPQALPPAQVDGVCLLTHDQDQWGVGYMAYVLAKQAGCNLRFAFCDDPLPESDLYLLPSLRGNYVMPKETWLELGERARAGAELILSLDDCILSGFEAFTGLRVLDSWQEPETAEVPLGDRKLPVRKNRTFLLEPEGAEILVRDNTGNPAVSRYSTGKGRVSVLNFPLERYLMERHLGTELPYSLFYKMLLPEKIGKHPVRAAADNVFVTLHPAGEVLWAVAVNHNGSSGNPGLILAPGWEVSRVYHGDLHNVGAYDACVFTVCRSGESVPGAENNIE